MGDVHALHRAGWIQGKGNWLKLHFIPLFIPAALWQVGLARPLWAKLVKGGTASPQPCWKTGNRTRDVKNLAAFKIYCHCFDQSESINQ